MTVGVPSVFQEESFLRQALGREMALDLLEGFLPQRQGVGQLTSRGIMRPHFVSQDYHDAVRQEERERKEVASALNGALNPQRRPSIADVAEKGLIPETWMVELYGLADSVRKKHRRMESAVDDLKSRLNVPPILADVVATDVLTEMEAVDPQLIPSGGGGGHFGAGGGYGDAVAMQSNMEPPKVQEEEDEERPSGRRGSNEEDQSVWWRTQIESLRRQIEGKEDEIGTLRTANGDLEAELERLRASEHGHLSTISVLEEQSAAVRGQTEEMNLLREQQSSIELHRLDSAAIEMELSRERNRTEQLRSEKSEIERELYAEKERVSEMEQRLRSYEEQKVTLIQSTNEQMNQLREYLLFYQRYFHEERARKEERARRREEREREVQQRSVFGTLFG